MSKTRITSMRNITPYLYVVLVMLLVLNSHSAFAESRSDNFNHTTPGELIVRLHADASDTQLERFSRRLGAVSIVPAFLPTTPAGQHPTLRRIFLIRFPKQWALEPLRQHYERHPAIEAVEMNRLNRLCAETEPNDPEYTAQWNLQILNAAEAWDIEQGDRNITVAVVDSGIATRHPEFRSQLWENSGEIPGNGVDDDSNGYVDDTHGWDFSDAPTLPGSGDWTGRDNDPEDETGHGTHVAGIIASKMNNGVGGTGIAPNCRLMPLRAGFKYGGGTYLQNDDLAGAIVYAADNGAAVINMSWGDTVRAFIIEDAIAYAHSRGCVLVGAAGNASLPGSYYPAALQSVISVAGIDREKRLYGTSNFGATIDIAAPGEEIFSTDLNGGYRKRSGTSMAAAHVSGVAALMVSANRAAGPTETQEQLIATAQPIFVTELVGAGALDASAALTATAPLIARIKAQHIPENVEIFGSAGGARFATYWLEYGISEVPNLWYPLGTVETEPRINACLYTWDISALPTGRYTVRLSVKPTDGNVQRVKTVVDVDHSASVVLAHESQPWLSGQKLESVVTWETDALTTGTVEIFDTNGNVERAAYSDAENRLHIVNISDLGIPPGIYKYQLSVENRAGHLKVDDNNGQHYQIEVKDAPIPTSALSQVSALHAPLHVIAAPKDINGNGILEIFAVDMDTGTAQILEVAETHTYEQVFSYTEPLWPWAAADTDNDGLIEILCNVGDTAFLLEQPSRDAFPTTRIWEAQGHWSRTIVDADGDGTPEIFARNNATHAISVYEATGNNDYRTTATLPNPTAATTGLSANFATGDFDGDGKIEILAGNNDGTVFIYEATGNDQYKQTWITTLPEGIPQLFAAGDMDNDGNPEFAISTKMGTHIEGTPLDIRYSHSLLTLFKAQGDNTYRAVWQQRIREAHDSGNGMIIADANNDGRNELCIAEPPNFYMLQYDGTDYQPMWHHTLTNTFNPIVADLNGDGTKTLLFNSDNVLTLFQTAAAIPSHARSPSGFTAKPIDERSVYLTWEAMGEASTYTLYRGTRADSLQKLRESVPETHYTDTGLAAEKTYWYAIAYQDSEGLPSKRSTAISVRPTPQPRLRNAAFSPPNQVVLTFDKAMGTAAAQPGRYRLEKQENLDRSFSTYGPRSAILDKTQKRVILTFSAEVFGTGNFYRIQASGLSDIYGAPLATDASAATLTFPAPTLAEVIVYPNPAERCNRVTFDKLPAGTNIHIYDTSGHCIASLAQTEQARARRVWELTGISSGVYIYVLSSQTERRVGKLAVLR